MIGGRGNTGGWRKRWGGVALEKHLLRGLRMVEQAFVLFERKGFLKNMVSDVFSCS